MVECYDRVLGAMVGCYGRVLWQSAMAECYGSVLWTMVVYYGSVLYQSNLESVLNSPSVFSKNSYKVEK